MRVVFRIFLCSPQRGDDAFNHVIYAPNLRIAYHRLFRELGFLKNYLMGVVVLSDVSDKEIFEKE